MSQAAAITPFVASQRDAELPLSGIGWLDAARRDNLDAFLVAGLPDTRVEAFKYTALRALGQRSFVLGDAHLATRMVDPATLQLPGVDGPRLVFVNGALRLDLSTLDALPAGLTVQPLSQVLVTDAEPLRFALARHYREAGDAFAQLNAAFASDGALLRVAAGAQISSPVHLCFVGAAAEGDVAWHLRHVIELGEGAALSLIEHHATSGAHAHLGTSVADVVVGERARLQHVIVQAAAEGSTLVRRTSVQLRAGAHATLHALELGGGLSRHELQVELAGDGARLETRGAFVLHGRQHADTQMLVRHTAKHTASDSIWRGVADDRARGVFRGAIYVAPGADGSDAALSNKNLLLSGSAEIDTKPELEIHADEVKAAHGATVGQLDPRALFYLRSRGIPQAQARAMLTAAFCRAVLDDLPNEALREHLSELVAQHLPQD
ncbi:Fe-S cluster assembly protein SufD [Dyella ginsengisoli]|uniref:Fe-S cluster assembly protein SufD n=1 Tax=Dyella ginsengisoli TaxID=363848 RepID=A0ABW8JV02_9GAMM